MGSDETEIGAVIAFALMVGYAAKIAYMNIIDALSSLAPVPLVVRIVWAGIVFIIAWLIVWVGTEQRAGRWQAAGKTGLISLRGGLMTAPFWVCFGAIAFTISLGMVNAVLLNFEV